MQKTKKRTSWRMVSEQEFTSIKDLLEAYRKFPKKGRQSAVGKVAQATGRSAGTIGLIDRCSDLAEYKAAQIAQKQKYTKPKQGFDAVLDAAKDMPSELPLETLASDNDETVLDVLKDIRTELRTMRKLAEKQAEKQSEKRSIFSRV